jgi:hypothetical protein
MRVRWLVLVAVLGAGIGYAAYPYVTLLRLGLAIRTANAGTLESLVDWPSVREGIKEDVSDYGATATVQKASDALPPFGASFVRGIASNAIDQAVTPEALARAVGLDVHEKTAAPAGVRVEWAFFDTPTRFMVDLHTASSNEPIRLEMDLEHGAWEVERVWLPHSMLSGPQART